MAYHRINSWPTSQMALTLFETFQGERFKAHDKIDNRRLLWHGTKVAVVAAILKSGLRIMPHSGGRVGRGIYFASENSKSAGYGNNTPFRYSSFLTQMHPYFLSSLSGLSLPSAKSVVLATLESCF